jgi:uncharacterized protein YdhG (YjbR/CyaY superfamily)
MNEIDTYMQNTAPSQKQEMERIRKLVRELVPDATEAMSYGMPAFKYKGKYLVGYAAYKDHMSFFPTPEPIARLKDKLSGYQLAKGTVQFTVEVPLTDAIIRELTEARKQEIDRVRV